MSCMTRPCPVLALLPILSLVAPSTLCTAQPISLFDGKTLEGWEGETSHVWRVQDGMILGGSLEEIPQNEFLATERAYQDFVLRFEYRLIGPQNVGNAGVQFRSRRVPRPANEMSGYQADIGFGRAGVLSGALYDESRRNRILARPSPELIAEAEKPGEWNAYEVRAEGKRIQLFINGQRTVDYTETDFGIPMEGLIALQIHGGTKAQVAYRHITIEELLTDPVYHRFKPLPPAESLKRVHLPPGYRADIVVAEPMIQEPVWAAWDGNGVLYVAEMNSYMQDTHGTGTKTRRNGKIKRLVDVDGDGVMDRATVFVDDLLLPRMILALDERILVQETDSGSIAAYRDTDGDGVADEKTVMYDGPSVASSVEHQDSGLTWNIDNWMYTAQGGRRFRNTRGKWETERVFEEYNQWGLGMDDTGMMFYSQNSVPGRNFNQHWYYWNLIGERRNWERFKRPSIGPETDAAFQRTYRALPIGDRSDYCEQRWTSGCGLSIYRGDALPADFQGNMLLAEPCGHAVRRAIVTRDADGRRTLRNAYEGREFFMSEDFYCRPVSTHTGPDGCIYIVDMYRGIIQDSPWVSPDFAERIKGMGADGVKNRGRIYRISHEGAKPGPRPRLLEAKPAELVPHLAHANGWWRDMAQRLIILRADRSVVPALETMARFHANPIARLHALWTLEGFDALTPELLADKLRDGDYRLRAAAIRMHEPALRRAGEGQPIEILEALAKDPDPEVRRQLVLSLGWRYQDTRAIEIIGRIASGEPANPIITLAALTALHGCEDAPLVRRVRDKSLFQSIADAGVRAEARELWEAGIESWKSTGQFERWRNPGSAAGEVDRPTLVAMEKGARIYEETCVACHGPDGRGVVPPGAPALAPSLVGSARVLGPKEALVRILLYGLTGPVDGQNYQTGQMAALGAANPDAWSANVLTYIRREWGNAASVILPADVAAIRQRAGSRDVPWTLDELQQLSAPKLVDRSKWIATAFGHTPQNAIDGVVDASQEHAWHGINNPGAWIAVDLGRPYRLTHVAMLSTQPDWTPRGYEVELSNDGKSWTSVTQGKGTGIRTVASFEPVIARHFRITQTSNAFERWLVAELEVYGTPAGDN